MSSTSDDITDELRQQIAAYEVDVRFSDVSGMEHLDMLLTRSRIARVEAMLTPERRRRVQAADRELVRHAACFYAAIRRIADLAAWRARENLSPAEWWWYLDVLAHLPPAVAQPMVRAEQLEPANGDEPPTLRGYIRHVQSDAERYITDSDAILAFIEDNLPAEMRGHFVDTQ